MTCGQKRTGGAPPPRPTGPLSIEEAREYMLALVNADRQNEGLGPVEFDDIATRSGQRHAEDMVKNGFRAHWGSDGSVPEQRYTEAGGDQLVQENVTCFFDGEKRPVEPNPSFTAEELEAAERVYMEEKPPNDGHRKNILVPTHNRLGVGLAKAKGVAQICVAQEFVDAYGDYDALPKTGRAGQRITVAGRVEAPAEFGGVGIAQGPVPVELYASDLNSTSTYAMPTPYATYFPKGFISPREVKVENGRFSIELAFDRGAGRYAVSVWGRFPKGVDGVGAGAPTNNATGAPSTNAKGELGMLSLRTIIVR